MGMLPVTTSTSDELFSYINIDEFERSGTWRQRFRGGLGGLSTYRLNGHRKEDEHPAYAPDEAHPGLPFDCVSTACVRV